MAASMPPMGGLPPTQHLSPQMQWKPRAVSKLLDTTWIEWVGCIQFDESQDSGEFMGLAVGSSKLLFWKVSFWSEDCLLLFWCPSWCQSVDSLSYRLHVFRQGQCILVLFHRWMPATIWSRWHRRASRPTAYRGDPAVSVGGLQWQVTPLGEAPLPAGAASRENGFVATKIRTCWFLFVTWWSEDMNSKVPIVNPSFPMPVQYTWGQEFRWVKL